MQHPRYPHILTVGCVCAEHMTQDYVTPKARERGLRRFARRKLAWGQKEWWTSAKGNLCLNTDGFNIVVFQRGPMWGYRVEHRRTGTTEFSAKVHSTLEGAKGATLTMLLQMKDQIRSEANT